MIDIGTAPGSSNVARIVVDPDHPGTMMVIGADTGAPNGPGRKIDIFEDVQAHGNLRCGELHCIRARWEQGVDGVINEGVDDEVPRIEKLAGDRRLHVIGGGPLSGPGREVVLWDDATVARDLGVTNDVVIGNDLTVVNDLTVNNEMLVGTTLTVNGTGSSTFNGLVVCKDDLEVGEANNWGTVQAQNAVAAAGTFHIYEERGGGSLVVKLTNGYGFDLVPGFFLPAGNGVHAPAAGIPVAVIALDTQIDVSSITVTPWILGHYDETVSTPGTPMLIAQHGLVEVIPMVTVKSPVVQPGGGTPTGDRFVQQIEVAFYSAALTSYLVPQDGAPPLDFVFDVQICGSRYET